jgi:GT2 family glycosyltransferase
MILTRATFEDLGGFDETLETNEDAELCRRALRAGLSTMLCPDLAVVHLGTAQTVIRFYKKQRWHGKHVFKVFLRSPFRSGNERAILIAVYTLGLEISLAAAFALGVLADSWRLLWVSLALFFLPAIGLSIARSSSSRRWSDIPALVILFSTYGFARAHALFRSR